MNPAAKPHVAALDGIRGLAILAVLMSHASASGSEAILARHWLIPGWAGVDLFFVLSGYLITGILLKTKDARNRVSSFYMRRILRIFPVYYLALSILIALSCFFPYYAGQISNLWKDRLPYFFYIQNLEFLWGRRATDGPLGHFWSLAVEEQFYLVWPMLVWSFTRRSLLRLSIVGCVCALALRIALTSYFGPDWRIFTFTPCRGEGLLTGSIVAILTVGTARIPFRTVIGMGLGGLGALAGVAVIHPIEFVATDAGPYLQTIGISGLALAFAAVIGLSQYHVPILSRCFELPPLRSLGKYSYGIYVYHSPLFLLTYHLLRVSGVALPMAMIPALFTMFVMCAVSYLAARVSYRFLETPFLRFKERYQAVREEPRLHTAAAPIATL